MFCTKCGKDIDGVCEDCNGKTESHTIVMDAVPAPSANEKAIMTTASQGKRLVNYLIDSIVGVTLVGLALGFILGLFGIADIIKNVNETILNVVLVFVYYVVCESVWQSSIGKLITKTKVVTITGDKPGFGAILIRSLCRFIPFEVLSFLTGKNPIGWHDKLSKTIVVDSRLAKDDVEKIDLKNEGSMSRGGKVALVSAICMVVVVAIWSSFNYINNGATSISLFATILKTVIGIIMPLSFVGIMVGVIMMISSNYKK